MGQRTPWVAFKLDFYTLDSILNLLRERKSRKEISQILGMGVPKIESYCYWAEYMDLIRKKDKKHGNYSLTNFYKKISALREIDHELALELLYYKLCLGNLIISQIVNELAYGKSRQIPPEFTREEAVNTLNRIKEELHTSEKSIKKKITLYLKSLTDSEGFGRLGLFIDLKNGKYRVKPRKIDWETAAFSLYDFFWKTNLARIKIERLVSERNSLGRIFFLDHDEILKLLINLEGRNLISIETTAGLDQVAINPSFKNEDELMSKVILNET